MDKYKIKEELYKYYTTNMRHVQPRTQESWRELGIPFNSLEKVEEGLKLSLRNLDDHTLGWVVILDGKDIAPTEEQRILCEKVLNGDLVEKGATVKIEELNDSESIFIKRHFTERQMIDSVNEWVKSLSRVDLSVDLIASHRVHRRLNVVGEYVIFKHLNTFNEFINKTL